MTTGDLTLLAVSGSLRAASLNTALLRAAAEHAPDGVRIELFDGLGDVPPFNGDLEADHLLPEPVARLRSAVAAADGLLIATPEYNYAPSGVLKNAIDWASRPGGASVLVGKHIAITGASGGKVGTARAQLALRQILVGTRSDVIARPEVLVGGAAQHLDGEGRLTDETVIAQLRQLVEALRDRILATRPAN